jgi:enoyl-CoA hydratase
MAQKEYQFILYDKKDGVATVVYNRPEVHNAIHPAMVEEFIDAFLDLKEDKQVKVGVLTGAGEKTFCSGGDLDFFRNELVGKAVAQYEWIVKGDQLTRLLMERSEKPIIAAVNGICMAGGFEMALACDFIVASENAKFGLTEINFGLIPVGGGTIRLPRAIPLRKAREMIYTGELITAQEAENLGLVNKVVPKGQAYEGAMEIAKKIASKSTYTLRMAKKVLTFGLEACGMDAALFIERGAAGISAAGEGFEEGVKAFFEKRPPNFK